MQNKNVLVSNQMMVIIRFEAGTFHFPMPMEKGIVVNPKPDDGGHSVKSRGCWTS
jgi:hypothetical protein